MLEKRESITAKICAFARAYHSNFSREKIYDDYLAFDILGYDEYENLKQLITKQLSKSIDKRKVDTRWSELLNKYISPIPLSRIKYAEDKLIDFSDETKECQYVICGAGFDSFAFRNTNKNIQIYELDHINTQSYKKKRIKEMEWIIPDNLHFVSINFEYESIKERLLKAGFNPKLKTYFSILGVSYYLTLDTFSKTIESIASISAEGSKLVFDYPDDISWGIDRVNSLRKVTAQLGEKMMGGFKCSLLEKKLKDNNYKIIDYQSPRKIQEEYFSNRKDKMRAYENVHFVLAEYKKGGNNIEKDKKLHN